MLMSNASSCFQWNWKSSKGDFFFERFSVHYVSLSISVLERRKTWIISSMTWALFGALTSGWLGHVIQVKDGSSIIPVLDALISESRRRGRPCPLAIYSLIKTLNHKLKFFIFSFSFLFFFCLFLSEIWWPVLCFANIITRLLQSSCRLI